MPNNGSNGISILGTDGAYQPNDGSVDAYSILDTNGALAPYEEGNTYSILAIDGSLVSHNEDGLPSATLSAVTDIDASNNTVADDATVGTTVGITGKAIHSGFTVTYSLTDDAGGLFAINSSTGVVTVADTLTEGVHQITVLATSSDGTSTSDEDFNITVTGIPSGSSAFGGTLFFLLLR